MSVISQSVRPTTRHAPVSGRVNSASSQDNTKNIEPGAHSFESNGAVLRVLDSHSRQNAFSGQGGQSTFTGEPTNKDFSGISNTLGSTTIALTAVRTAIETDSSGLQATESAIATDSSGLEAAKAGMQQNLTQLASDPKAFNDTLQKAFGDNYDQSKAETIRQQVVKGDFSWMPEIKVVDSSVLQDQSGAQGAGEGLGAYSKDNDTIYISKQLLQSDPDKAVQILTEEVGHGLDTRLNTSDAAGDEGNIFARLVAGEEISDSELSSLQSENDSGTILVDGKEVEVEFFWKKIKKAAKKVVKSVKKTVKKATNFVTDTIKKTHDVVSNGFNKIKKAASKAWGEVKKGFKKVMESELLGQIMMVAQFIPIPMVQIAVRGYNLLKAGYATYQGIKHGSVSMALAGAAGVVGGAGKLGGLLGASSKFVEGAASISSKISTASAVYKAASEKDFAAAAGIASNFFGGADTSAGRALGTASTVATTVEKAQDGDILGALQSGRAAYTGISGSTESDASGAAGGATKTTETDGFRGFVDKVTGSETFKAVTENVSTIRGIVSAVKDGDYSQASAAFLQNYGDDLGISQSNQQSITKWSGVLERVGDTRDQVMNGNYSQAIGNAAGLLGMPLTQHNQTRLNTAFQIRDSVMQRDFVSASQHAASLSFQSGEQGLGSTFVRFNNMLGGDATAPAPVRAAVEQPPVVKAAESPAANTAAVSTPSGSPIPAMPTTQTQNTAGSAQEPTPADESASDANSAPQDTVEGPQAHEDAVASPRTSALPHDPEAGECLANEPEGTETPTLTPSDLTNMMLDRSPVNLLVDGPSVSNVPDYVYMRPAPSDHNTSDVPSFIGDAAAGLQGAAEFARDSANRAGTSTAASILTTGRGGNLPAPGFGSRASLAQTITRPGTTAADALKQTPFSNNARSTIALTEASKNASRFNGVGRTVGLGLQPLIGAINGSQDVPENATLGERIAGTVGGAIKEADDVAVSYSAGFGASALTTATGVGAPAAPAAGIAAGIAAGRSYDGTSIDGFVDRNVDKYVTPFVASAIDDVAVPVIKATTTKVGEIIDNVNSLRK